MGVPHSCEATSGEGAWDTFRRICVASSDGRSDIDPTYEISHPTDKLFVLFGRPNSAPPPVMESDESGREAVAHNPISTYEVIMLRSTPIMSCENDGDVYRASAGIREVER